MLSYRTDNHSSRGFFAIAMSCLLALLLHVMPLPEWAVWCRPAWTVLVLIYWVMALPYRVGLGWAWCLGLCVDSLSGSVMGEHALVLVLICYVVEKIHRQLRMFPLWQQAWIVGLLVLVNQGLLLIIQGMLNQLSSDIALFWLPALTSCLLWPWLFSVLRDYRRTMGIQ